MATQQSRFAKRAAERKELKQIRKLAKHNGFSESLATSLVNSYKYHAKKEREKMFDERKNEMIKTENGA